jgi:streptomycin 6-kinase
MTVIIPQPLVVTCQKTPDWVEWLAQLPDVVSHLQQVWSFTLDAPFHNGEGSIAWVAPVVRADGTRAVLKVGIPHMEGEHEIQGLHFWAGDPTVLLLEADEARNAMLLERCEPGISLRSLPEPEQDIVIAELLRRLWRRPQQPHLFRQLAEMTTAWVGETLDHVAHWPDEGLVREGLRLFTELPRTATNHVLLATDLHAGNVLAAKREPWLVIDPKPFVGDPAYDATQHLLNCPMRLCADPLGLIHRFAELLEVDHERVRLWLFARCAAEARDPWDDEMFELTRALG